MNIYFDCDPNFITLEKVADKTKIFEEIQEEEEDIEESPEELKEILKIRLKKKKKLMLNVIFFTQRKSHYILKLYFHMRSTL